MSGEYKIGAGIYDVNGPAAQLGMMGMANLEQKQRGFNPI